MATAVQTSSQPRTPNPRAKLAAASLAGGVFVLGVLAATVYLVPQFLGGVHGAIQLAAQLAIAAVVIWAGTKALAGANPPHGLRGGILLPAEWE